jgi:hypothetical protein
VQENPNAIGYGSEQNATSKAVQNAALHYIRKLREQDPVRYERPQVMLIEKGSEECQPSDVIKDAAREELKKVRQADNAVCEGLMARTEQLQLQANMHWADLPTAESSASSVLSLPPHDSPLTKIFLGYYLSLLVQETITYRRIRYGELAREMSLPEKLLQDAVQGQLGLTRGHWVKLGQLLSLATNFELRQSERNCMPCWELCYPPVRMRR